MKNNDQESRLDDPQWMIDRYVLEDPSLDRAQFEAQMLSDPALALDVADTVRQMHEWAEGLAWPGSPVPQVSCKPSEYSGDVIVASRSTAVSSSRVAPRWLASAVVLMLALGVVLSGVLSWQGNVRQTRPEVTLNSRLVDSWLALEGVPPDEVDGSNTPDVVEWEYLISEDGDALSLTATHAAEPEGRWANASADEGQEDWLVEAAREFYSSQVSLFSSQGS